MITKDKFLEWQNLCDLFADTAGRLAERPCLWSRRQREWHSISWREVKAQVGGVAQGMASIGIEKGDRIAIVADNCPEWLIAELAILALGAVAVPAYTTNTVDDHLQILDNVGVKAAFVAGEALTTTLCNAAERSANCRDIITMSPPPEDSSHGRLKFHKWEDLLGHGFGSPDDIWRQAAGLKREDLAVIFHTSGTGGAPRGVMLTHGSILANCLGAFDRFRELIDYGEDIFLSFLPLSHAYEHATGQFTALSIGAQIYYCDRIEHLMKYLREVRPTIVTGVPRLYEVFHSQISQAVNKQSALRRWLFHRTVELGQKRYRSGGRLSILEQLQERGLMALVRKPVAERFGGRLKFFVSGGAPLNYDVASFLDALGLRIIQGYGQTEAGPVISSNPTHGYKLDSVGPALEGVEITIADDGEILVRGELVMRGYCGDEKGTSDALRGGWLHTGDVGFLDQDGHLHISDRKKDIIVTSGGENISPQRVEGFLALQPEISQAMVYGDKRPHLVAVLVPDMDFAEATAMGHGGPENAGDASQNPNLELALRDVIHRVNKRLGPHERIRDFVIAKEAFRIENGMLTPSLKIRRHVVGKAYGQMLAGLYN